MKEMIARSEFEHLAPASAGTVRVNHSGGHCSGTSESMLITRKENGDVRAYCFRCGASGFVRAVASYKPPAKALGSSPTFGGYSGKGKHPPTDASKIWVDFPRAVRRWLSEARISGAQAEYVGILWSDSRQTLFIPIKRKNELAGWVVRTFGEDGRSYRILTDDKDNFYGHVVRMGEGAPRKKVALVEDALSGLRVGQLVDCIVLCGTSLRPSVIEALLTEGYEEALIFLDADNSVVRRKARAIAKRLPFLRTRIVETGKDPKHHTDSELVELLELDKP